MIAAAVDIAGMSVVRHRTAAVDAVSLTAQTRTWFGLIGANGSGKTSLLRALVGRLACEVESCCINGVELRDDPIERARRIGFMPPAELLPGALTCRQVFSLIQGDESVWRAGTTGIFEASGLDQLLDRKIGDCSAGMRQRIAIGCAFAADNAIVILDEPFNWLDPVAAYDLRVALRERVAAGLTLITALHDMLTLAACDEGLLLGGGKVVARLDERALRDGREHPADFELAMINLLRHHSKFA